MTEINIAEVFSKTPGGRFLNDGPATGERFRRDFLMPALQNGSDKIKIILDGTKGLPSSFLEEAFGGLIRSQVQYSEIKSRLEFEASEQNSYYAAEILEYIDDAVKELGKDIA